MKTRRKKSQAIFLFFFFAHILLAPAQSNIDSLTLALKQKKIGDESRVDILLELGNAYRYNIPEKADSLGREALALAKELDYKKGMADAHRLISSYYWINSDYDHGVENALASLRYSQASNYSRGEANAYTLLGLIASNQNKYTEATRHHEKAMAIYEALNDSSRMAVSLNNIGVIYHRQFNYIKSKEIFEKVAAIQKAKNNWQKYGDALNNLGAATRFLGNYEEAIGILYETLSARKKANDKQGEILTLYNLGVAHIYLKNNKKAETILIEGIEKAREINSLKWQDDILWALKEIKKTQGEFEQSIAYFEEYKIIKDSIASLTEMERIAEMNAEHEAEKKEREIADLQRSNQIRRTWQYVTTVVLLLVIVGAFFIYRFFRYRNKMNRKLIASQKTQNEQLREMDEMKSRFFANISHEFRTPLSLIMGPIDVMLEKTEDNFLKKQLYTMERNAHQLLRYVNQLLDLSKIESGKMKLKATRNDMAFFLQNIFSSFQSMAGQKGIVFNFKKEEDEVMVFFEKEKMENIITNLLSNAFKFTPENGMVLLGIKKTELNGKKHALIYVEDTGCGIPEDLLPHVFDRFFQADTSDTKAYPGTGIGLALVKELVALHKGHVSAESTERKGSIFKICLPLGREHLLPEEVKNFAAPEVLPIQSVSPLFLAKAPSEPETGVGLPMLLIVEDNDDLRQYIRMAFENDYEIYEATNGRQGVDLALEHVPDLIISDVMMPIMDGHALCKVLKTDARTSHIPIVLLTAKSGQETRISGFQNMADDFLEKPFHLAELKVRTHNLVALRKKIQEKFQGNIFVQPKGIQANSMEKEFLEKIMEALEEKAGEGNFGVEELSRIMGMSRVHLHRKMKALTNCAPNQFIRRFRLLRAMDLLKQNAGTIGEIAFSVGFSSPSYFSKCFAEQFGFSPKEVKTNMEGTS